MFTGLKGPLALLVLLVVALVLVYGTFLIFGAPSPTFNPIRVNVNEYVPGPPSPEVVAILEKSRGFEVLISYEDNGFWPKEATIRRGESVRFFNASSQDVWIAAAGADTSPVYPGTSECGASLFDSCKALQPRDFWEFTFEKEGVWNYQNNLEKRDTGIVRVEAP